MARFLPELIFTILTGLICKEVDGPLASVWANYKFYLGTQFSHCGLDYFQLLKTSSGWKIIYIIDTRRKDNCPE